jgi:hypothetical protein
MEKIVETTTLIKKIGEVCDTILKAVEKRRTITPRSSFIQKTVASSVNVSSITAWSCLQELLRGAMEEATIYQNELKCVTLKKVGSGILVEIDDLEKTPELTKVWLGDEYGCKKNKGFSKLLQDLSEMADTLCSDTRLIEKVLDTLKNES